MFHEASTFHSVYISTALGQFIEDSQETLHSTLFILVQHLPLIFKIGGITLHSTLFILVPDSYNRVVWIKNLYIPLCLY